MTHMNAADDAIRAALFAMPPPRQFLSGLAVGVLLVALIADLYFRKGACTWTKMLRLSALALVLGSVAGAGLAGLLVFFGGVHPLDRWPTVLSFTIVGFAASSVAAATITIVGVINILRRREPPESGGKP
jgi:hypothetical protein